ncbi:hypothetical protein [Halovivax limisalsi]|uniref:hypothetical protein n=1 Tax=Halovivax limisalsi TaxID=1453760 RepID=UPI001FFD78CA|nr:hypothetical protein [Halovivax limisalsi]
MTDEPAGPRSDRSSADTGDADRPLAGDADPRVGPDGERTTDRRTGDASETTEDRHLDGDRSDTPDGRGRDATERDPEGDEPDTTDSGVGWSALRYALELTVALVGIGLRILWTGIRIAARLLSDSTKRRRWRRWLLLEADRMVVVGGFVAGIFVLAMALGLSDVIGVRESRFVTTMFSTMIAGLFSFIPIVVAVNQLIISRLFGTPDRLTERIDGVQEFRRRVESQTDGDGVSPTDPAPFLARLAGSLGTRAGALVTACSSGERVDEDADEGDANAVLGGGSPRRSDASTDGRESICGFGARTREHAESLSARLTGEVSSVFDVVLPTLDHDYAGAANEARRLADRFDANLDDRSAALLADLRELFVAADATRQYFTTIYLQRELARLSRLITYSGTAAILLSSLVIMIYASGYPPVAFEGWLLGLVSLALAVAFSPLAVLFAYVVRVSTILRRTSAPGAFTPTSEYHRTNATDAVDDLRPETTLDATDPAIADGDDAGATDG